jgi:hypothetical protein
MQCDAQLITAQLCSAQRKHRFVYCRVIVGACFDVTVLAWHKYATICYNHTEENQVRWLRFEPGTSKYKSATTDHLYYY